MGSRIHTTTWMNLKILCRVKEVIHKECIWSSRINKN